MSLILLSFVFNTASCVPISALSANDENNTATSDDVTITFGKQTAAIVALSVVCAILIAIIVYLFLSSRSTRSQFSSFKTELESISSNIKHWLAGAISLTDLIEKLVKDERVQSVIALKQELLTTNEYREAQLKKQIQPLADYDVEEH